MGPSTKFARMPAASRFRFASVVLGYLAGVSYLPAAPQQKIGQEHALDRHLADGEEFTISTTELIDWGLRVFRANWTEQDGAGRPLTKGNGLALSDPTSPLSAAGPSIAYRGQMQAPVPIATTRHTGFPAVAPVLQRAYSSWASDSIL